MNRIRFSLMITLMIAFNAIGCGYMVGNAYQAEIRTVHVPMFTSSVDRRGIEFQLTEAVQKQIQQRTPFHLVKECNADTRLTGTLVEVRKNVRGESRFDDPRQLQFSLYVEITWEDLRTGRILAEQRVPIEADSVLLRSQTMFAPEVGESLATANKRAIDNLAIQVVDMMETPW